MTQAEAGKAKLIAELEKSGTGADKLAVANAADVSKCATANEGILATIEHMAVARVNKVTMGKASAFAKEIVHATIKVPPSRPAPVKPVVEAKAAAPEVEK